MSPLRSDVSTDTSAIERARTHTRMAVVVVSLLAEEVEVEEEEVEEEEVEVEEEG